MKKLFIDSITTFIKNQSKRKLVRNILNNKYQKNISHNVPANPVESQSNANPLSSQNISLKDLYVTISNAVEQQLSAQNLHQKTFSNFENKHTKQDIVLVGTGPSAIKYTSKNFMQNALHIGVNKAYLLPNLNLDYFFMQDVNFLKKQRPDELQILYQSNYIKFFGLVEDCQNPKNLTLLANNSFFYHTDIYSKRYNYWGCWISRFTTDLKNQALGDFGSVIFSAIQFALYTNPKRIYLVGCDCSDNGYFDQIGAKDPKATFFVPVWQKLKEFASRNYPNIEIISINPVGLKGLFKDTYTD